MNVSNSSPLLEISRINQSHQSLQPQSKLRKIHPLCAAFWSKRMQRIASQKVSIPSMYRLSGESVEKKIPKLELLERINQHNRLHNPYNSSDEPIDIHDRSASSWDMFTEQEIALVKDALLYSDDALCSEDALPTSQKDALFSPMKKHKIDRA